MSQEDMSLLRKNICPVHLSVMRVDQLVVINIDQVKINKIGPVHKPDEHPVTSVIQTKHELITKVVTPPELHWYCVAVGVGFTGICCGTDNLSIVIPSGRRGTLHAGAKDKKQAKAIWKHHYYSGRTAWLQRLVPLGEGLMVV
jgi:hypothetical protein